MKLKIIVLVSCIFLCWIFKFSWIFFELFFLGGKYLLDFFVFYKDYYFERWVFFLDWIVFKRGWDLDLEFVILVDLRFWNFLEIILEKMLKIKCLLSRVINCFGKLML